jgi:iron complex transport system permease protein
VAAVYGFSRLKLDFSPATLLLTGVAVNFFFSSLVMLFQHLSDPHNAARIVRAMTGGLAAASYRTLDLSLPFVLAPAELPAGVVTSLCGGPFFPWLLLRSPAWH